jgi:geranylgeranyl diphosphate synthase type II
VTVAPVRVVAPARPAPLPVRPTVGGTAAEAKLHELLLDATVESAVLGPGYRRLWTSLADAAQGGKRFRSALFAAAYDAWGGTDAQAAGDVGAALELLHTAFLVHDDVIDGDDTRRGRLNVSGTHAARAHAAGVSDPRAREYGAAAGILAGDLALAAALRTIAFCPAPQPTVLRLFDLFDRALHTTAAGELADVWLSLGTDRAQLREILVAEQNKTAAYSFTLPLQAAAVLARAPEAAVRSVGEVGRLLGVAFQLVDDLLGVFGDPAATGKSALSDLRAGKQTPVVAHARTTPEWREIETYVGRADLSDLQAELARDALTRSGSRAFVQDLADDHARAALAAARSGDLPPALVGWIEQLSGDLLGRSA